MPNIDTGIAKPLTQPSKIEKIFVPLLIAGIVLGLGTGYYFSVKASGGGSLANPISSQQAQTAGADNQTFRDFAEGVIQPKPTPKTGQDYSEGTHLLMRDTGTPVALTSSVVDLSKYVGKKVRVLGETQKALKEGWLMDVGKVEEIK